MEVTPQRIYQTQTTKNSTYSTSTVKLPLSVSKKNDEIKTMFIPGDVNIKTFDQNIKSESI